jgi:hypothetical protein
VGILLGIVTIEMKMVTAYAHVDNKGP